MRKSLDFAAFLNFGAVFHSLKHENIIFDMWYFTGG